MILQTQGLLGSVVDLSVQNDTHSIVISWRPPYSLNVTGVKHDIWYTVLVANLTEARNWESDTYMYVENTTNTWYNFTVSNFNPGDIFKFTIIPFNKLGYGNGSFIVGMYLLPDNTKTQRKLLAYIVVPLCFALLGIFCLAVFYKIYVNRSFKETSSISDNPTPGETEETVSLDPTPGETEETISLDPTPGEMETVSLGSTCPFPVAIPEQTANNKSMTVCLFEPIQVSTGAGDQVMPELASKCAVEITSKVNTHCPSEATLKQSNDHVNYSVEPVPKPDEMDDAMPTSHCDEAIPKQSYGVPDETDEEQSCHLPNEVSGTTPEQVSDDTMPQPAYVTPSSTKHVIQSHALKKICQGGFFGACAQELINQGITNSGQVAVNIPEDFKLESKQNQSSEMALVNKSRRTRRLNSCERLVIERDSNTEEESDGSEKHFPGNEIP